MEVIGGVVARVGFSNSRGETESEERGAKKPYNYHTPQWQYPYSTPFNTGLGALIPPPWRYEV